MDIPIAEQSGAVPGGILSTVDLVRVEWSAALDLARGNGPGAPTKTARAKTSRHWHSGYPLPTTVMAARLMLGPDGFDAALAGVRQARDQDVRSGVDGPDRLPFWGMYQIVWRRSAIEHAEVVGDITFHGPPDEQGTVEIGYAVVPAVRGRGIATAACSKLLAIAWRQGALRVAAETELGNAASQRVLIKSGFRLSEIDAVARYVIDVPV